MTSDERTAVGRVAGIDFGTVRIGIAITDVARTVASPYETYSRAGPVADGRRFRRLVEEEDVQLFVVGLPVHMSGQESEKSRAAREFGAWLSETTQRPVEFFDERYTTVDADRMMEHASLTRKQRKRRRDMLAAQVMLAAYLESSPERSEPGPLDDGTA